jgi:heavy metal translocating P-type ATPase
MRHATQTESQKKTNYVTPARSEATLKSAPPDSRNPLQASRALHAPESRKLGIFAILTLSGIVAYLALRFLFHASEEVVNAPLFVVLIVGGLPLVFDLAKKAVRREFGSDLLAGISIVTATLEHEYLVAAIVVLMLSGGAALEAFATRRASSVLDALAKRMPQSAHRKRGKELADVTLEELQVGDIVVIYPHEVCPADGTVVEGQGRMNEAYLTGEPYELDKTPGSALLSGALNGETALTMRVDKLPVDSRYARIMRVMEETQQRRPRLRRLGDQLGAWYTPAAVLVAVLAWLFSGEAHRFLAVLVIATPCPLLIAIPVAVIGAISLSARRGIIIKNPAVLEQIDTCQTAIFDKTGTLTYGQPTLTDIVCASGFEEKQVLGLVASLERYSKHPLAVAILRAAEHAGLPLEPAAEISECPGEGLRGVVGKTRLRITGRNQLGPGTVDLPPHQSGLECLAFVDGKFAALFRFHDAPRADSRLFVSHLGPHHNITRVLLVSGDRDEEARFLAQEVGIQEVHAGKSPEDKVEIARRETAGQKTLFVGDGINDAPAMQAATVGVAFGQNSDVAAEAADAVVLESSLGKVDELIHIGRRMRSIALQSVLGGMALSILGMIAAAFGYLPPIGGAIAQEVIDLLAVLNAVRVALPFRGLRDF